MAVSTEVSCAVSQEECFFINRSHKKFRYVWYTLCVFILSEIHDKFLLKDHRKLLQAKKQLYKPQQQLLSDFLCVHLSAPIHVWCFFMSKTLNKLLPEWKVSTCIFMLHPSKASWSYSETRKAVNCKATRRVSQTVKGVLGLNKRWSNFYRHMQRIYNCYFP